MHHKVLSALDGAVLVHLNVFSALDGTVLVNLKVFREQKLLGKIVKRFKEHKTIKLYILYQLSFTFNQAKNIIVQYFFIFDNVMK